MLFTCSHTMVLWQQVIVHYVKQTRRHFQLSWRIFLHLRNLCHTTPHASLMQWALFKSKSAIRRPFQMWPSCSSTASLWKVDNVKESISFDVWYQDKSIKNVERLDKRGAASAIDFKSILGSHKIKQWHSFIKGSRNNMEFIRFMCSVEEPASQIETSE